MNNALGERISELLKKRGISQRELAERVKVTEVSMSRYINGERKPRDPILANIAAELQTTPEYLLNIEATEEGSDLAYYRVLRAIARNAHEWTLRQKKDLINALLGDE